MLPLHFFALQCYGHGNGIAQEILPVALARAAPAALAAGIGETLLLENFHFMYLYS